MSLDDDDFQVRIDVCKAARKGDACKSGPDDDPVCSDITLQRWVWRKTVFTRRPARLIMIEWYRCVAQFPVPYMKNKAIL
ncbi:hypothetical protein [Pantoea vagans]|uniref:hypothetical protein n=1 Tax=Pantoea vagans TaxID=470934 RepID=UPI003B013E13